MADEDKSVAQKIQDNRTRVQKKAALHKKRTEERAKEQSTIKAAYQAGDSQLIVQDLLKKARGFAAYHIKIASDGVGARATGHKLTDGTPEIENIYLKPAERVSHLDKAAGIQEIIDYVERQLLREKPEPNPELEQVIDNAQADANDNLTETDEEAE